jgi:DNA-binding SARP family transcriptional activator/pimeloyl-ACP methyl ester carboxylesterase
MNPPTAILAWVNSYSVFGRLTVVSPGGRSRPVSGHQASVLAMLLVSAPAAVSRDLLIDQVYRGAMPADPRASLHNVVSRLRSIVGEDLSTTADGYSLASSSIDSVRFEEALARARRTRRIADYESAIAERVGAPYPGLDELEPVRLEAQRLDALLERAQLERWELIVDAGRPGEATSGLEQLVSKDPDNEAALAAYMNALYRSGRRPQALRAFRAYASRLRQETGLDPSAELRELELAMIVDEVDPPKADSREPIPVDVSVSFIERRAEERVAVGRMGEGPPIVVHPGWLSNLDMVASGVDMRVPFWSQLATSHTLYLFDRYGTGLSVGDPQELSFQTSVEELTSVLRQVTGSPVPVLAASGAGPIAIQAAAQEPGLISSLILLGTYASGPATFRTEVSESMVSLVRASWGLGSQVLASMMFPSGSAENRQAWSDHQRDLASVDTACALLRQMFDADVSAAAESLSIPILILHYDGDKGVPIRGGEQLAGLCTHADFVKLVGISHYPLHGDEREVAELIERFLASASA